MVKCVFSSNIYKIFGFQPKLPFYLFLEKLNFSRVLHQVLMDLIDYCHELIRVNM